MLSNFETLKNVKQSDTLAWLRNVSNGHIRPFVISTLAYFQSDNLSDIGDTMSQWGVAESHEST